MGMEDTTADNSCASGNTLNKKKRNSQGNNRPRTSLYCEYSVQCGKVSKQGLGPRSKLTAVESQT